jgi:hypothetical protein
MRKEYAALTTPPPSATVPGEQTNLAGRPELAAIGG